MHVDLHVPLVAIVAANGTWAVFRHEGHVSSIGETCAAGAEWLAREGRTPAQGPVQMVEYYGPQFDPHTGNGGWEIWMPLET